MRYASITVFSIWKRSRFRLCCSSCLRRLMRCSIANNLNFSVALFLTRCYFMFCCVFNCSRTNFVFSMQILCLSFFLSELFSHLFLTFELTLLPLDFLGFAPFNLQHFTADGKWKFRRNWASSRRLRSILFTFVGLLLGIWVGMFLGIWVRMVLGTCWRNLPDVLFNSLRQPLSGYSL